MYKFSILIPAYENEKSLKRALNSLGAQNYNNIEIIVSDDCSKSSNLKKVCEEFNKQNPKLDLKYYYQNENLTPTPNTKFLMEKASGEFIMIFPHDDYLIYNDFFNE